MILYCSFSIDRTFMQPYMQVKHLKRFLFASLNIKYPIQLSTKSKRPRTSTGCIQSQLHSFFRKTNRDFFLTLQPQNLHIPFTLYVNKNVFTKMFLNFGLSKVLPFYNHKKVIAALQKYRKLNLPVYEDNLTKYLSH